MLLPHVCVVANDLICLADVIANDFCDCCFCHSLISNVVVLADVVPSDHVLLSTIVALCS